MIKKEFIELIQRRLAGGEVTADVRGKYHEDIISRFIGIVFNPLLWELVKVSQATRDFSPLDVFTRDYIIPKASILTDAIRGQYYVTLPAPLPQLIGNSAIRYVGSAKRKSGDPGKQNSTGYLYRNPSAHDVFGELDVELVDQKTRYSPENNRIYFHLLNEEQLPDNLLVKLITDYAGFNEDQDLPIPGGQDDLLFDRVVEKFRERRPEETRNDNVINQEQQDSR